MSIAEKLLVVSNNLVTESEEITEQESLLQQVNAALDGKTSSSGYSKGYEAGKKAEYDAFWDALQENGNRKDYNFCFAGDAWDAETFKPKYPIKPTTCYNGFAYWGISTIAQTKPLVDLRGVDIDFSQVKQGYNIFANNYRVCAVGVIDFSNNENMQGTFNTARNLHTVEKFIPPVDDTIPYNNTFNLCMALENIIFGGPIGTSISFPHSSKLTNASVQSIIDNLKDLTGTTAQTLTLHATVGANLTQAQEDAVSAKNWTLVY